MLATTGNTSVACINTRNFKGLDSREIIARDQKVIYMARNFNHRPGGVRHDPQRFMGKTVYVPHFNRDTVEFASRERDGSKPGIKVLLPFLKNITEESDLENFQDLILALYACYGNFHKFITIRRRSKVRF